MVWGCFAAFGPGQLALIERTLNFAVQQKILKKNVPIQRTLASDFKLTKYNCFAVI